MPIVTGKNQRWRVLGAHAFLVILLVVTLFPLAAVILKKLVSGLAPAMAEASYRSTGIALSSPVHSTRKYGYPSQVLTTSIIVRASSGSANQAGLMPKTALRMPLISPKFWLNRPLKTRIEMKPGTA